jgi:cytochrome b6-f complex iron-sulfur subunit
MMTVAEDALPPQTRRGFLASVASIVALGVSYGLAGVYALKFLYPGHRRAREREVFVALEGEIRPGAGLRYTLPSGQQVSIQRTATGFVALSNVCPHLGCKVRWEPQNGRFFCPCHEGTFAPDGSATGGPPKAEGKNLARFETRLRGDALYIVYREA